MLADRGWLEGAELDAPVISVGNIQAGGAGKTPLVAQIAREADERFKVACILSRGYGGEWETRGGVISPGDALHDPLECGDEPALLHELCPKAWIGIGADRAKSYLGIKNKLGAAPDIVILDDGFQHWKIKKTVEIVAVTSASAEQQIFRDTLESLSRAHLVVWTKGDRRPEIPAGVPLARVRFKLRTGDIQRKYWLVTGIAGGGEAVESARSAGYEILKHIEFADHARYGLPGVSEILAQARAAGCAIALTGKDWVKWRALGIARDEVEVLEPEVIFEEGRENWNRVLWERS